MPDEAAPAAPVAATFSAPVAATFSAAPVAATFSARKKGLLFFCMCLFHLLTFIFFNLPYSFLPIYNEHRNISTSWTGVILGSASLGLILTSVGLAPILLTKYPTRYIMSIGAAGLGVFIFIFALLHYVSSSLLFEILATLIRFIKGTFAGCLNVTIFKALVSIYPENVATATSIGEAVLNGAVAFGPFLGSVLYEYSGFSVAFVVPGSLILISAVPALLVPNLNKGQGRKEEEEDTGWKSLLDPWVMFPLWHLASAQVLLTYHMPLLPVYAEVTFQADVVWGGTALLISTAVICASSPVLGWLIDKFGALKMMAASAVALPLVYVCIGPLPLLSFIQPSKTQLILALAFLGFAVPMACIAALPAMFQVYKLRHGGALPVWIMNTLVALYCSSYPVGIFIGSTVSGFIAPYASFGWSTGGLSFIYLIESAACIAFCLKIMSIAKNEENPDIVMENPVATEKNTVATETPILELTEI